MSGLFSAAVLKPRPRVQKDERLAVRITADAKQTLEQAATISGRSLTDFVVNSAMAAAQEAIERVERMHLTEQDRSVFIAALTNPPEPNEALRAAAKRHRKLTR